MRGALKGRMHPLHQDFPRTMVRRGVPKGWATNEKEETKGALK